MHGRLDIAEVGGHFIMTSPANNQMGHGFYQFSPELFFRIFSEENGYELRAIFLVPTFSEGSWFKIKDPATVGARVGHNMPYQELSIFAIARRTKIVPLFLHRHSKATFSRWVIKTARQRQGRESVSLFRCGRGQKRRRKWKSKKRYPQFGAAGCTALVASATMGSALPAAARPRAL